MQFRFPSRGGHSGRLGRPVFFQPASARPECPPLFQSTIVPLLCGFQKPLKTFGFKMLVNLEWLHFQEIVMNFSLELSKKLIFWAKNYILACVTFGYQQVLQIKDSKDQNSKLVRPSNRSFLNYFEKARIWTPLWTRLLIFWMDLRILKNLYAGSMAYNKSWSENICSKYNAKLPTPSGEHSENFSQLVLRRLTHDPLYQNWISLWKFYF